MDIKETELKAMLQDAFTEGTTYHQTPRNQLCGICWDYSETKLKFEKLFELPDLGQCLPDVQDKYRAHKTG